MWFDDNLKQEWNEGFKTALGNTGYDPIRIDQVQHNDKIDDVIIGEIRRSGLVVADFTGQRSGVYFEAGFAKGLAIPVIWTCRTDHMATLHFDTRQYDYIVWKDPRNLRVKLRYRIVATIQGRACRDLGLVHVADDLEGL